eukprot:gene209-212_t
MDQIPAVYETDAGLKALANYLRSANGVKPTEFDGFVKAQRDFLDDLYSGNLLADVAHESKVSIDRTRKVPNLEELLKEMEEEERLEQEARERAIEEALAADGRTQEQIDDDMLEALLQKEEEEDGAAEASALLQKEEEEDGAAEASVNPYGEVEEEGGDGRGEEGGEGEGVQNSAAADADEPILEGTETKS